MNGRRAIRRLLALGLALGSLAGLYFAATLLLPPLLEPRFNRTHAPGPWPASPAAVAAHQAIPLIADMHADSLLWSRDLLRRSDIGHVDIPRLIEARVGLQAFTIVTKSPRGQNIDRNDADTDRITDLVIASGWPPRTWTSLFERALYQMNRLHGMAEADPRLRLLRSRQDLLQFEIDYQREKGQVAAWLGLEGAHALEGDLANLDRLHAAGLRMAGITHFFDNALGGSQHGMDKGGLTAFGRQAVARMQELGILVDLAHASDAVIADVLAMSTRPVVVSHGGVKGSCDNNRTLSDGQIFGIAATGGLIGIGYWPLAVCGEDALAIARAIRYVIDIAGVRHVALGSDFDGSVVTPFDTTGLPQITGALMEAGLTEAELALIMGGNVRRVLLETLPER